MIKVNGLTVKFQHTYVPGVTFEGKETKTPVSTKAIVIDRDGQVIAEKVAVCYFKDKFEKRVGRKIALSRALTASHLPKEERKEIWDTYLKKNG